jgi:hypothetical protein
MRPASRTPSKSSPGPGHSASVISDAGLSGLGSGSMSGPTALNMMHLVNAAEGGAGGAGAGGAGGSAVKAGHDFVVEVSPDSLAFLRSFGEMALNVVSVFGGGVQGARVGWEGGGDGAVRSKGCCCDRGCAGGGTRTSWVGLGVGGNTKPGRLGYVVRHYLQGLLYAIVGPRAGARAYCFPELNLCSSRCRHGEVNSHELPHGRVPYVRGEGQGGKRREMGLACRLHVQLSKGQGGKRREMGLACRLHVHLSKGQGGKRREMGLACRLHVHPLKAPSHCLTSVLRDSSLRTRHCFCRGGDWAGGP